MKRTHGVCVCVWKYCTLYGGMGQDGETLLVSIIGVGNYVFIRLARLPAVWEESEMSVWSVGWETEENGIVFLEKRPPKIEGRPK